jgi:D-alanine-D-alanine ligase
MSVWRGKKVGLLLGGLSPEREVSLQSGKNCGEALRALGHDVVDIDVGLDVASQLRGIDVAFIALHGRWGEDGCIQGLLEALQIPYTHSGVLASAAAMNKLFAKRIFQSLGIKTAPFDVLPANANGFSSPSGYPCIVKPNGQGSSVGVSLVKRAEDMPAALKLAGSHAKEILVEHYIKGREINVAVIDGEVLGSVEIRTTHEFYDYDAKYVADDTQYLVPAPIGADEEHKLFEASRRAYEALGCSGAARVDVIMDASGEPWLLEVNTLPGMTSHSLVPKIAAHRGIDFKQLVGRMLEGASLKS